MASNNECSICLEHFRDPKFLKCFHTFCKECIQDQIDKSRPSKKGKIICPLCREKTAVPDGGVEQLQSNFYIQTVKQSNSEEQPAANRDNPQACDICDAPAAVKCLSCELAMCTECKRGHENDERFALHIIKEFETNSQMDDQVIQNPCPTHANFPVSICCVTCSAVLCVVCTQTSHKGERCMLKNLEMVAHDRRFELQTLLKENKAVLVDMLMTQSNLELDVSRKYGEYDEKIENIERKSLYIQMQVSEQADELIRKIRQEKHDYQNTAETLICKGRTQIEEMKSSIESPNEIVTNASDRDIIELQSFIKRHLTDSLSVNGRLKDKFSTLHKEHQKVGNKNKKDDSEKQLRSSLLKILKR